MDLHGWWISVDVKYSVALAKLFASHVPDLAEWPFLRDAQDPSVMSAALCALHDVIARDPQPYKNLIPSFISILKQACHSCSLCHL